MPKIKYSYVDSCVFLAYFNNQPGRADILEQLFDEITRDNERKLVTSVLSIVEVANVAYEKERQKLDPDFEQKLEIFWSNTTLVEFVDIYEAVARSARTLMRRGIPLGYSLRGADALHLASAQAVEVSEFLTYDDKLKRYSEWMKFEIVEPSVHQPRLPL